MTSMLITSVAIQKESISLFKIYILWKLS